MQLFGKFIVSNDAGKPEVKTIVNIFSFNENSTKEIGSFKANPATLNQMQWEHLFHYKPVYRVYIVEVCVCSHPIPIY